MRDREIDQLIEVAIGLEESSPYEAYRLLLIAKGYRPSGPRINAALERLETMTHPETVVAWRHDGLCERLISIIIGFHTAKALNLKFAFVWPDERGMREMFSITGKGSHSVPCNPGEFLDGGLIDKCLLAEESILHPRGDFYYYSPAYQNLVINSFGHVELRGNEPRPFWLAANRTFPDLERIYSQADYSKFFYESLFSSDVRKELAVVSSLELPERRVAIHVRGGDIVYGETRLVANFGRLKSITLAVADEICRRFVLDGYTVLVFGATRADLRYLAEKHPQVCTVDDLALPECNNHVAMIREVALMADCELLISSEDTAVTKLATLIGKAELRQVPGWLPIEEEYSILQDARSSKAYVSFHTLQQAYMNYSLFATAPEDLELTRLCQYAIDASNCDEDNIAYMVLAYFGTIATRREKEARALKSQLEAKLGQTVEQFLLKVATENRFIRFDDSNTLRIIDVILSSSEVDADFRAEVRLAKRLYAAKPPQRLLKRLSDFLKQVFRK